jgi:hypothetical protein
LFPCILQVSNNIERVKGFMTEASSIWPNREDYDLAMHNMQENIHDSVIKYGTIISDKTGPLRYGGANHYVTLYQIGVNNSVENKVDHWMVRCFCCDPARRKEPPADILTHYQRIDRFCNAHLFSVSVLVPVYYVDNAISVDFMDRRGDSYVLMDTKVLPYVRMPFIPGPSIGSFVAANYKNSTIMEELCDAWIQMIRDLEGIQMAHGDLDLTNVIVARQKPSIILKLIDYDNAWIPTLNGLPQTELGHDNFRHPAFKSKQERPHDQNMDRFSALTMYISLKALAAYPNLYIDCHADEADHLLLTRSDYEQEMCSAPNNITVLKKVGIPGLNPCLNELSRCLREKHNPIPTSLLLLVDTNSILHPPGPFPGDRIEPSPDPDKNEEIEISYLDWNKIEYTKQANEPLIVQEPEKAAAAGPTSFQPWTPTEPATTELVPPSPTVQATQVAPPKKRSSAAGMIITLVVVLMLILIVLAILWFSNVIPHSIFSGSQSWATSSLATIPSINRLLD